MLFWGDCTVIVGEESNLHSHMGFAFAKPASIVIAIAAVRSVVMNVMAAAVRLIVVVPLCGVSYGRAASQHSPKQALQQSQ